MKNANGSQVSSTPLHRIDMPGSEIRILLDSAAGTGFSLIEMRVPPGFVAPPVPHCHTKEVATFIVREGAVVVTLDGVEHRVETGGIAVVAPETMFTWRNANEDRGVHLLCTYTPGGFERFFLDVQAAVRERGDSAVTPELMREIIPPLWEKYGLRARQ
jgi:mannose-6-phosphate isomerase-like protein (cupin superfamily)